MTNNQLKFVVFILNKFARAKKISVAQAYNQFNTLKILDDYIIKHYDVLHTLGENYLIDDLTELVLIRQGKTLGRRFNRNENQMKNITPKRKILAEKLKLESQLVREESMVVLREFELTEDNNSIKNQ